MGKTVAELIEVLQGMPQDAEVRVAHQPSWPFEYEIDDVAEAEVDHWEDGKQTIVYLADGMQLGYLPQEAKEALGWDR